MGKIARCNPLWTLFSLRLSQFAFHWDYHSLLFIEIITVCLVLVRDLLRHIWPNWRHLWWDSSIGKWYLVITKISACQLEVLPGWIWTHNTWFGIGNTTAARELLWQDSKFESFFLKPVKSRCSNVLINESGLHTGNNKILFLNFILCLD